MSIPYEQAITFLEVLIKKSKDSSRLDPIPELAKGAGVSPATMWKAIQKFKNSGVLSVFPKRGILVHNTKALIPKQPINKSPTLKWQRLQNQIESDLLNGIYPMGSALPPNKQLMHTYGVCFSTLKKAVEQLLKSKVIELYKKRYKVTSIDTQISYSTILLIGWSLDEGFLRSVDIECSKIGTRLRIVSFIPKEDLRKELAALRKENIPVIGSIVSITGGSTEQYREVIEQLLPLEKPIAVLDLYDIDDLEKALVGKYTYLFKTVNNYKIGNKVGQYLLSLGHRTISYLSNSDTSWSYARYNGLNDAFLNADPTNRVHFLKSHFEQNKDSAEVLYSRFQGDVYSKLPTNSKEYFDLIFRSMEMNRRRLTTGIYVINLQDEMNQIMKKGLQLKDTTAWVAGNDWMALACLDYLKAHKIKVPENLSVFGFDDIEEAFSRKLTTYNYNHAPSIGTILSFITTRRVPMNAQTKGRVVESEGFIVTRNTVAKVNR